MIGQRTKLLFRLSAIAPLSLLVGFWFALRTPFDAPPVIRLIIKVLIYLGVMLMICALISRMIDQSKPRKL